MSEPLASAKPVEAGGSPRTGRRFDAGKEPYVGPRPFEMEHKSVFFGREREAVNLMHRILAHDEVLIHSPSGAGKTSLINASLIPLLEEQGCELLPVARVNGPSTNAYDVKIPNIYVFHALRSWSKDCSASGSDLLTVPNIKQFLAGLPSSKPDRPNLRVIIFDQFEELFTAHPDRVNERKEFFEQLRDAMTCDPMLRVVFSMREDYLAELKPYGMILPEKLRSTFQLSRLSPEAALEAITKPLQQTQFVFAPGAAEKLVENLQKGVPGGHIEAMQLQVVCQSLWGELDRQGSEITSGAVEAFADVNSALARYYENAIRQILQRGGSGSSVSEGKLRRWFQENLITPAGTRGTVFRGAFETGGMPNEIVDELVFRNLIRCEERANANWFELAHDRFIKPIQDSNHLWLSKRAGVEESRQRLEHAAQAWIEHNRGDDYLLDLAELTEAQRWLKNLEAAELETSAAVQTFVQASHSAIRARNVNRLRRWVAALSAATILAALFGGIAWFNESKARVSEQKAKDNEQKAEEASLRVNQELAQNYVDNGMQLMESGDPAGAFLWFLTARDKDSTASKSDELYNLRLGSVGRQLPRISMFWQHTESLVPTSGAVAKGENLVITASAEYSPDRKFVIAAMGDVGGQIGAGVIWPADGVGKPVILPHSDGRVTWASFSPDGKLAVTTSTGPGGTKGSGRLWQFNGLGKEAALLKELAHTHPVTCAAFSSNSRLLVTAGGKPADRSTECLVLDTAALAEPKKCLHDGMVTHVVFNKKGNQFVTTARLPASGQGEARIYDADRVEPLCAIRHDAPVNHAAISPDDQLLATASGESGTPSGYLLMWDIDENGIAAIKATAPDKLPRPKVRLKHGGPVVHVEFSPDRKLVTTASHDSTARIYDWESQRELILPHRSSVFWSTFSPDGMRVATTSRDWTARVWDASTGRSVLAPLNHNGTVSRAYFDDHSRHLLTSAKDTIRTWDLATNTREFKTRTIELVDAVVCSHDQKLAVTSGGLAGRGPHVAYIRGPGLPMELSHDGNVQQMVFSQDDKSVLTVSVKSKSETDTATKSEHATVITVWDASGKLKHQLSSTFQAVNSVALSGDNRFVVVGAGGVTAPSGQIEVWDLQPNPNQPKRLTDVHDGGVLFVGFSSTQSNLFVSASADDTARVWEIGADGDVKPRTWKDSKGKPVELRHAADLIFAAFSEDNRYLVTTSQDCYARVWDLETGQQKAALKHPGPVKRVAFRPIQTDSNWLLVTADLDGRIFVWDIDQQELITYLKSNSDIEYIRFTPDRPGIQTIGRTFEPGRFLGEARHQIEVSHWDLQWKPGASDVAFGQLFAAREWKDELRRQLTAVEDSTALQDLWNALKQEPGARSTALLSDENWHRQAADEARFHQHWSAEVWHLNKLIEHASKEDKQLTELHAAASANALDFNTAIQDYDKLLSGNAVTPVQRYQWLVAKAEAYAELERWQEAMESVRAAPPMPGRELSILAFMAVLHLRNGDLEAYQKIGPTLNLSALMNDRLTLNFTWLCMLAPGFRSDLDKVYRLATELEDRYPSERRYLTTSGAILYRQGKYEDAITKLNESRSVYEEQHKNLSAAARRHTEDGVVWDNLLLAMAHDRLKHDDQAKKCWSEAHDWYVQYKAGQIKTGRRLPWHFRVAMDLLYHEAEGLLQQAR